MWWCTRSRWRLRRKICWESIRATSQRMGQAIHDLSAHQQDGKLFVELHLEVDETLTLREAHRQATELEEAILKLPGHPAEVNIHIEPMGSNIATTSTSAGEMKALAQSIEQFVNTLSDGVRRSW